MVTLLNTGALTLSCKVRLRGWCLWYWCVECGLGAVQVGPLCVEWVTE